jgi:hypothetical protein
MADPFAGTRCKHGFPLDDSGSCPWCDPDDEQKSDSIAKPTAPSEIDQLRAKLAVVTRAAEAALVQFDDLATIWGNPVVFGRLRDRLRAAITEAK